jgi:N-acetylglucosaminyl-diphospho-decaprenol L-rhamnosyltransferase
VPTEAPVCVIVVNYNGGSLLRRCIETLGSQTLPPQEVIIVDNGSADGSIDGLEDLPLLAACRTGF